MEKTTKISAGQAFVLLFMSRVMYMMLFKTSRFDSGTPYMLTQLLATMVECLAVLPVVALFNTEKQLGINENKMFTKLENGLFCIYFLFISVSELVRFAAFIHQGFSEVLKPWAVVLIISAVSCYCALGGIESLARVGTVVLWIFLGFFLLLQVINDGKPDFLNVTPVTVNDLPTMLDYCIDTLSSNWWLPLLVSIRPYLRKGIGRAAFGFLLAKFIMVEVLILLVTLILWRFFAAANYPMLALGSYARTEFIQHFGAINMLVWSLNCILVNGVYLFTSARGKKFFIPVFAAVSALAAIICHNYALPFDSSPIIAVKLIGIVLLGIILPLIRLTVLKIRSIKCVKS